MKQILRGVVSYVVALYVTQLIFSGLHVGGGWQSLVVGGVFLAFGYMIVKPILSIVSFPFNLITLGLFSWIATAAIFFLITKFDHNISVSAFKTPAIKYNALHFPSYSLNLVLSYIAISATIYLIAKLIEWVFAD